MLPDRVRRLFRVRFTRDHLAREIDEELADHVERRAEALMQGGMPREEAYAEARRRFGNTAAVRDHCLDEDRLDHRRATLGTWLEHTWGDLRFALRALKRSPGFAAVAFATLVTGIAAFVSIFSYYNAVYHSALPYYDADRVFAIGEELPKGYRSFSDVSQFAVVALRQGTPSLERIVAYEQKHSVVLYDRDPVSVAAVAADTGFIPLFDLRPQSGRLLSREEILGDVSVAMISDQLWRTRYGAHASAIGKTLPIDERSYRIVGVLPPGFRFPYQTDALIPMAALTDAKQVNRETVVSVLGKLRRGATREQAQAEVQTLALRLAEADKAYRGARLVVRDEMLDRRAQQFLPAPAMFLGAGLFLLLIACANVTSLFYVRSADRRGEMAIRASLGGTRARLIRQALAEGFLISAVAAIIGTWVAQLLVRLWLHFVPTSGFPSWFHVGIDSRVLLMAIGVTALVTMVVSLSPALEGTRFDLVRTLKGTSDFGSSSRAAARGSKRGLIAQLALSVALFIAAALLVRSFQRLLTIDVGYRAERVAVVYPMFSGKTYEPLETRVRFAETIAAEALAVPGVQRTAIRGYFARLRSASPTAAAPYDSRVVPDGDTTRAVRLGDFATMYTVSDSYFDVLGLRVRNGRRFSNEDFADGVPVAIINATLAMKIFGVTAPLGHTIQRGTKGDRLVIVGIVDDVRDLRGGSRGFRNDPVPTIYVSSRQSVTGLPEILATGAGDVLAMRSAIVERVRAADPRLILLRNTTLASQLEEAFLVTRVFGGVIGAFAVSALALSIIGIYGVAAFGIAQRTRELGIRIALGGTTQQIMRLVTAETLRFVLLGVVIGLALAVALSRVIKIFLFGVSPLDPATYVAVAIGFAAVALLASYLPARRVTKIDPLKALRAE